MVKNNDFVFLDGAMGTMIQDYIDLGERPEDLNITRPEVIRDIHKSYIDAGSKIIYTNTFGANKFKLSDSIYSTEEIIGAAVDNAKKAAKNTGALVALDIGPLGEMMEPSGPLKFEAAYDAFKEVVISGVKSGCDLIVIETMTDLYELKAAILAARENSDLDILTTMTFEANGRTFTGVSPTCFVYLAERLGVTALGVNCSLGPIELYPIVEEISKISSLPLIVKANAGLPDPVTGNYDLKEDLFSSSMAKLADLGVKYIGGCCGTNPNYIKEMIKSISGKEYKKTKVESKAFASTATNTVFIDDIRIIGERINPTGKKNIQHSLKSKDLSFLLREAVLQTNHGAEILDVNVGFPGIDETELLPQAIKEIQAVTDAPIQIDCSNPKAIENALRVYNGCPIINSVNGTEESMDAILPLAAKYGASLVVLTLDEDGIPETAEKRIEIAEKVINRASELNIGKERLFVDALTLTASAEQASVKKTLDAMRIMKEKFGVKLTLGVSNISFGLPNRDLLNSGFLMMALQSGLDLPIIDPLKEEMTDMINCYRVLSAKDVDSGDYIQKYSNMVKKTVSDEKEEEDIFSAISKGLKKDTEAFTLELLKENSELELVENFLIPALDMVGDDYEKGNIFLPQLIRAANASQVAFEIIKQRLRDSSSDPVSKGKILLATVKGDIHDIGKNIVKVILENYGYDIIDLGRDVDPEKIAESVVNSEINLVGLSALMTTSLDSMKNTIMRVKEVSPNSKIMVGGAVLTADYSKKIGADFYAADAKASVEIARKVFGKEGEI
ncbi:MAG: homocysteine S-methyltransferase family protein [Tissierellia bacterium]|nr:homocysteine S-methyltransferase family protein [Tissierellia bacterium]